MKYIDEYRDPELVAGLLKKIGKVAAAIAHPVTIMEICGSHTYAIGHFGIRKLLAQGANEFRCQHVTAGLARDQHEALGFHGLSSPPKSDIAVRVFAARR